MPSKYDLVSYITGLNDIAEMHDKLGVVGRPPLLDRELKRAHDELFGIIEGEEHDGKSGRGVETDANHGGGTAPIP